VLVSAFILLCSFVPVIYWLRSSILTLLEGPQAAAEAARIAEMNRLEFPLVRQALETSTHTNDYGRLMSALKHDFLTLTYLLRFAATINVGQYSRQEQLLVMDFHLMRLLCVVGRWVWPGLARYALAEMTCVLEHFAAVIGQRISTFALDLSNAQA
jgi:hypothetical protein